MGNTGLTVSEIGFGTWGMGGGWGPHDDAEHVRALQLAFELGVTFFDTARAYGNGRSERLIGRALGAQRDQVVLASKIPPRHHPQRLAPDTPAGEAFPADWIIQCTEDSLRNLGTDYLDLQQLHRWLPHWLEEVEWWETLERLRRQGKIRAFGVSANPWDVQGPLALVRSGHTGTVQEHYNLFFQEPQEELFPAAREHGVGIIVRVPFEEGLLTGKLTPQTQFAEGDWRAQWLTADRLDEVGRRLEALQPFLAPDRPTPAALALKFCLSDPAVSTVIPGMRTTSHVEANCAVSDGILLSESERAQLQDHAFGHGWKLPWL